MSSSSSEPTPENTEAIAAGLRLAVIGARRVNDGTGQFLARQAHQAGATVVAVVGTSYDSARQASESLQAYGLNPDVFAEEENMFDEVNPDAVIIASPTHSHLDWVKECLEHRVHVLCEKPIAISNPNAVADLIGSFTAQELVIAENCQWPFTLNAWQQLHPAGRLENATSFSMMLSPALRGEERWQEILSHPISLIQKISPGPAELVDISFSEAQADAPDSSLRFVYQCQHRQLQCEIILEDMDAFPPPAEYSINGELCHRLVGDNYEISFSSQIGSNSPSVSILDPMEQSLRQFLKRVNSVKNSHASVALDEDLIRRQFLVDALLRSYRQQS
ncbi:MAG: Gfo/Idh/MocA family oxidoreductase [Planctomycetota bacterium]|nr:Gfo/Idh/MocA family oxidoreductase [Planctomycetota bacterium]